MASVMDVTELVSQMQDTLATIHSTLRSLDSNVHDAKLDDLETKRDDAIQTLTAAFSAEADSLDRKRKAEREEIAERRRKEDEERDRRRREEDKELAAKENEEDRARDRKLKEDTRDVEQETDELMSRVEEEARAAATEGRKKLETLQERRRELNRLIEEQLEKTLPALPVVPKRRMSTRTSTSPSSLTDRKVSEPFDYAPHQQKSGNQAELPEAAAWPLTPERAVTNVAHDHQELQEPAVAPKTVTMGNSEGSEGPEPLPSSPRAAAMGIVNEANFSPPRQFTQARVADEPGQHSESPKSQNTPSDDVAGKPHEVDGAMNHGVDIPDMEEVDIPDMEEGEISQMQVAGEQSSTGELSAADRESAEPLNENTAPQDGEEYQADHGDPTRSHLTKPGVTSQSSFEAIPSPEHQPLGHHPEFSMVASEAESPPYYYHDLSDVEESPISSPREKQPDEDAYSHVSEASGPPPFSAHTDGSGYVSENADASDANLSHQGESYIEEDEASQLERSHPAMPQDARTEPGAFTHATEAQGRRDAAMDADPDDNLPRLHPSLMSKTTPEDGNAKVQNVGNDSEATHEQEGTHAPAPEAEQPVIPQQERPVDTASSKGTPGQEHDEAAESETGIHDALGIQESGHVDTGPELSDPSQDDASPLIDHGSLPGPDGDDHEHEYDEARIHQETTDAGRESPVDYRYRGYRRSSPEADYISPQTSEPGEREGDGPEGDEPQESPGHGGDEDDDTDTDSQRFVTPLPYQNSLRVYYQPPNSPHDVDTDDYIGRHYYEEEDPRQYELAHQHSTTVHGEDHLFDDTDQSQGPGPLLDSEADSVATSQPGSPVFIEHWGQTEEMIATRETEGQRIPEVTVKSSTSPENPTRTSWIEEVDSYFEEDESGPEPETPPTQAAGLAKGQASSNAVQGDLSQESPVSTGGDLSAGQHNTERPQTPTRHESLASSEEATLEKSTPPNTTNTPWRVDEGWTPQSVRTHTPFSSPPASPLQRVSTDKHKPITSINPATSSPGLREQPYNNPLPPTHDAFYGDETESNRPMSLTTPWQARESPDLSFNQYSPPTHRHSSASEGGTSNPSGSGSGSGSLFKRMRSIFEPGRPHNPPHPQTRPT
ncbi:hypothetical protein B0I37DRAFT_426703 [Chaetomium sp. MPI-CAGE-AT-0009]|nr:hypothetical protein B0I37DRAFT_426703 [Chaetomium sp. MPI-CAGE-AT-0009]